MRIPFRALRETAYIQDFAGSGAHGPVYAGARQVRASVQPASRLLVDDQGREVVVEALLLIRPEAGPVAPQSLVTCNGVKYRVVTSLAQPDSRRPTHHELMLSRSA